MQGNNDSSPRLADADGVAGEPVQSFRQGFWRFQLSRDDPPRATDLEFVRSADNNTRGLGISEEGLIFGSTANGNPGVFVPVPNRDYKSVRGWSPRTLGRIADSEKDTPIIENVRQVDRFGGYAAGAGHALDTARAFPRYWWNRTAFRRDGRGPRGGGRPVYPQVAAAACPTPTATASRKR